MLLPGERSIVSAVCSSRGEENSRACHRIASIGGVAALLFAGYGTAPAGAAPPTLAVPEAENPQPSQGFAPFGFLTGIGKSSNLLGDMWRLRPLLSQYGLSLAVSETSEILGNVTGGVHRGADNLLTLQTASGIEAEPGARLWELWYQQKFLDEDRLDVRVGQMSLDQEFIVSTNALLFLNTMFGWPLVPSADLPGGGPAYPLSALGVRLRARPTDALTGLLAVTNGNPAPNNLPDAQQQNPSGTSFPLNGGVLVFGELQYAYPAVGALVTSPSEQVHAGTFKVGFWYNSEQFDDLLFDTMGLSLANPLSNG